MAPALLQNRQVPLKQTLQRLELPRIKPQQLLQIPQKQGSLQIKPLRFRQILRRRVLPRIKPQQLQQIQRKQGSLQIKPQQLQ